ncbi:hypothetical protein CRV01_10290 [Arcobacter sp. CECT 8983]|uniref:hypothetical protein n=1 Tax=Arcobacter sp. CECT 8983 TaxID=2044508 RepID=UPI00100B6598|nr:hypothetical protein [Arcobacter sp. CECT 8983]RXJ89002.1 hypothetical protein CRV01_10290 [Arcobacter sp. CECT 8983]
MTDEELRHKKLSNKSFTEHQIWLYSVLTAVSMSFFLALIGSGSNFLIGTFSVQVCIFLFTVSLISNATSTFIIASHKDTTNGREYIKWLNESKYGKLFGIAIWSFVASILVLIFVFSILSTILFIAGIFIAVYYVVFKSYKEYIDGI